MQTSLEVLELSVVILARNHNPSILNPDFLKHNEIVPKDWELDGSPVVTQLASQVKFKNGIGIVAQLNKIIFAEAWAGYDVPKSRLPDIVKKYVDTLPHVNYQAVGVNPRGQAVGDSENETDRFVLDKLMKPGPWVLFAGGPTSAKATIVYQVNNAQLTLGIESGTVEEHPKYSKGTPIVIFTANFHRALPPSDEENRIQRFKETLDFVEADVQQFRSLVDNALLEGLVQR